jgi:hypothetical protein
MNSNFHFPTNMRRQRRDLRRVSRVGFRLGHRKKSRRSRSSPSRQSSVEGTKSDADPQDDVQWIHDVLSKYFECLHLLFLSITGADMFWQRHHVIPPPVVLS